MNEQISAAEGRLGRVVVIRLAPGADLLNGMQTACERYGIHNGVVISAIGSLACVRFCNVGAGGVICSDVEGHINLHVHISMSDKTGKDYGGHLVEGTRVLMTADIVLGENEGVSMLREYNEDMDVYLLHPQQLYISNN